MDLIIVGAIVVGLVQLFKETFSIVSRYIPIVTLITTVVLFGIFLWVTGAQVIWEVIQNGLIVALTAMGLWSGTKAVAGR